MSHFKIITTLLLIIFTVSSKNVTAPPKKMNNNLTEFLVQLLQNRFTPCSLLHIYINSEQNPHPNLSQSSDFDEVFDQSIRRVERDAFVVQVNSNFDSFSNAPSLISPNKSEESLTNLDTISDVHRFRDPCTTAILTVSHLFPGLSNRLYTEITKWSNVIKKDEDYFIFIVSTASTDPSRDLVSSQIGAGIKYKVLLQSSPHKSTPIDNGITMSTTCFYCDSGKPKALLVPWGRIHPANSSHIDFADFSTLFPDLTGNFYGKLLAVGTPMGTRWLNELRSEEGKWVAKRGLYKIVMDNLMSRYNFSCDFFPSMVNGGTGSKLKNGTWIGSVGNIVHKTADLGHVTGQTFARNRVVGFTYPVSYEMLTFSTGEPFPYFSWKAILWPLATDMWIGLGASFMVANIVLYLIIQRTTEQFDVVHIVSAFVCFWLFFTLVISTAYKSKLVSLLSFPNAEEPPKTFEELASSDYAYALQYLFGAAYVLLQTSPNPTYQKIFNRMELETDDVACFERVIGKKFVCISWSRIADFVFKRNLSDQYGRVPVIKAAATTCFLSVGIIMEKRAVFLTNFNLLIIRSTDSGLMERWWDDDMNFVYNERRTWEKEANVSKTTGGDVQGTDALTNKHFRGSYYLLALGSVLGIIMFVWELILHRKHTVKEKTFPLLD
ncbi:putative glutamate receptor [Folsomia candida]|uniref:Putative glutamate receptor n=1 Tax=Folsomia candida TaxID=158441 RepID=A0A226DMA6_FOLCA|nr:putative glutamate receptor [Folsomia candida]